MGSVHFPYSLRDLDEKVRAKFSYINTSGIQRAGLASTINDNYAKLVYIEIQLDYLSARKPSKK